MKHIPGRSRLCSCIALIPVLCAIAAAPSLDAAPERSAAPPPEHRHPAYVDGTHLIRMLDADDKLVEVTLRGRLLRLFTSRAVRRADEGLAAILADLVSLKAIIAECDASRHAPIAAELEAITAGLEKKGWERFVYVRESSKEEYSAYIHFRPARDGEREIVDGLTVLGFTGEGEMLFVNLAGTIDMERIASLGERLGVPGLKDLPPASEVERERKRAKEAGA